MSGLSRREPDDTILYIPYGKQVTIELQDDDATRCVCEDGFLSKPARTYVLTSVRE